MPLRHSERHGGFGGFGCLELPLYGIRERESAFPLTSSGPVWSQVTHSPILLLLVERRPRSIPTPGWPRSAPGLMTGPWSGSVEDLTLDRISSSLPPTVFPGQGKQKSSFTFLYKLRGSFNNVVSHKYHHI